MKNPWLSLPEKPLFVLPCDRHSILSFNTTARDEYRVHNEELPEPYTGNISRCHPESCVTREASGQRWKVETNSLSDWRGKERA